MQFGEETVWPNIHIRVRCWRKSGQECKQGRNLKAILGADLEATKDSCLLACSPWLAEPAFLKAEPPRDRTTHSRLGPSPINHSLRKCPRGLTVVGTPLIPALAEAELKATLIYKGTETKSVLQACLWLNIMKAFSQASFPPPRWLVSSWHNTSQHTPPEAEVTGDCEPSAQVLGTKLRSSGRAESFLQFQ